MNTKTVIIISFVVLAVILIPVSTGLLSTGASGSNSSSSSKSTYSISISSSASSTTGVLSADEVAKHNTKDDCYMIVNDKVYDVTSYIDQHPGGPGRILPYCGKDGTVAFETKGGRGSHSPSANEMLSSLFVGDLVK